jgi:hypothetical protein
MLLSACSSRCELEVKESFQVVREVDNSSGNAFCALCMPGLPCLPALAAQISLLKAVTKGSFASAGDIEATVEAVEGQVSYKWCG